MRVVAPQEAMVCGWVGCGPFEWCDGLINIYITEKIYFPPDPKILRLVTPNYGSFKSSNPAPAPFAHRVIRLTSGCTPFSKSATEVIEERV